MSIVAKLMQDPNLSPAFRAALAEQTHTARFIITEHIRPPVPSKQYDWRATFDGYDAGDPMGHGPTEEAAIADLLVTSEYEGGVRIRRSDTTPNGLLLSALDEAIKRAMDADQWADYSCEIEALHEMRGKVAAYRPLWAPRTGETE